MIIELWLLFILMGCILFGALLAILKDRRDYRDNREKMVLQFNQQLVDFENEFNQNNRNLDRMFILQSIDPQEEMRHSSEEYNHAPKWCTTRDKSIS